MDAIPAEEVSARRGSGRRALVQAQHARSLTLLECHFLAVGSTPQIHHTRDEYVAPAMYSGIERTQWNRWEWPISVVVTSGTRAT